MERRTLGQTGISLSVVGFGASPLGNVFRPVTTSEGIRAVHFAIDQGIDFFDVSPYYGDQLAEERLGTALIGKRHHIVLATKCGRYASDHFDFSAKRVKASVDESLTRLKTEYVDLLQAHDVEFGDVRQIVEETIPALQEVQKAGKARFIGVTGYQLRMLTKLAETTAVDTVLSYCRHSLLVSDIDTLLTPALRYKGCGLILASPMHMGLLSSGVVPTWHPASPALKEVAQRIVELCRENRVAPATVALHYCLSHPYATSTLVGMSNVEEVQQNLKALNCTIAPELLAKIGVLAATAQQPIWTSGRPENADEISAHPHVG